MDMYIEEMIPRKVDTVERTIQPAVASHAGTSERCPDCGEFVCRAGGCPFCPFCGWSKCP